MTSGGFGDRGARREERKGAWDPRKAAHATRASAGRWGAGKLALSLVARALKQLLLLVFTHLLAAFLDYAAHSDTSAAEMREDV
jgi:hypothetical protein